MDTELSLPSLQLAIARLPKAARNDFDFWRARLGPVLQMRKGMMRALALVSASTGIPLKTVQNKFYAAKRRGLPALIDRRLAGPRYWNSRNRIGLSQEDKELVKLYAGLNQRSTQSAMKQLRRDWLSKRPGDAITKHVGAAGVEKIRALLVRQRPLEVGGFPVGWSATNLGRYAPSKFELKAERIGRSAAKSERPLVYTGRKDLWVGSHVMLDDKYFDFFINTFAANQAGRPLELSAHDLFPAYKRRWGIRVRTRKDDGKTYNTLAERMTRMILAATLYLDGYSPRGTIIVAEHGTAAVRGKTRRDKESAVIIREGLDKALFEMSGGLITVERSGMEGAEAHAGQYPGLSRGNSNMKASLESSHNLAHNVFAPIPGQTGKDVAHRPEQLNGMLDHNRDLLIARKYLAPERAALLDFPLIELNQFMSIADEFYRAIHEDPDHELDQWVECGHVVNELLIGNQWLPQETVLKTPEAMEFARHLIDSGSLQSRPRKMTRGEVWRRGASDLIRIGGYGVCAILGDDLAAPRNVASNRFEFEDREVGPGIHRFDSIAFTPEGEALQLRDGETYETFVNPFAPETLFVRRANGAYIGECRRIETVCRADVEAVQRRCGEVAKREGELLLPLRRRHMAEAREKARRHEHNARVLGGQPITPEEKSIARIEKSANRFGRICAELAEISPGTPADTGAPAHIEQWDDAAPASAPQPEEHIEQW